MKKAFDSTHLKKELESVTGFPLSEQRDIASPAKNENLCTTAHYDLGIVVQGLLVDMDARSLALAARARDWLEKSIAANEPGTFVGGRSGIRSAHAFCRWLLSGADERDAFRVAIDMKLDELSVQTDVSDLGVDDAAALLIHAEAYDLIATLEDLIGRNFPGDLDGKSNTPRAVGLHLARALAGPRSEPNQLMDKGRRLLRKHLYGSWIERGRFLTALSWLKIVHWDLEGQSRPPAEVVRKALDYLKPA